MTAPLTLPLQAHGHPLSWPLGVGLAVYSAANLILLSRRRRFERYVVALIAAGVVFVPLATALGGGVTGSSPGLVWAFLVPAYAIMALGPRRATPWFVAFLVSVVVMVLVDPLVRSRMGEPPYVLRLIGHAQNAVLPLTITFLLLRYTDLRRREAEARAEALLTNAIPTTIAARLKRGERRIAESYPDTTVLFADIVGFTPWAQATEPQRVVALLDDLFRRFDALTDAHGLEKIKTIGDAYMAVAGAPHARSDHASAALDLGVAILRAADEWRSAHDVPLQLRVGLASGPVVAGVIGERRFLFDLWGDTVNTAARMESTGVPGRVQLSAGTWHLVRDTRRFDRREVDVRGLGRLTTYLLAA